jgi:hypothetical protein
MGDVCLIPKRNIRPRKIIFGKISLQDFDP